MLLQHKIDMKLICNTFNFHMVCVCVLPVGNSLLQLFQQVFIKFVELGQIVQDLIQHFLLH